MFLATAGAPYTPHSSCWHAAGINGQPESMATSGDGKYLAIVYEMDNSGSTTRVTSNPSAGRARTGRHHGRVFAGKDMYVVDRLTRVTDYDLPSGTIAHTWQGPLPVAEKIYRYALHPLYTVFPKPGQLNETVNYVLTSQDTKRAGLRLDEWRRPRKVDIWGPVWSNLAFLVVVLALACGYMYRKDF